MELSDILVPDAVKLVSGASSKKRLFQSLSEVAASIHGVDALQICHALQDRENLGPTGVGNGVALPHARLPEIENVFGVFFRLDNPLDFDAVDKQPVDLVFGLFAPENAGVEHLKALALVSRTLRDRNICSKLRANADEAVVYTILTEAPSTQAA